MASRTGAVRPYEIAGPTCGAAEAGGHIAPLTNTRWPRKSSDNGPSPGFDTVPAGLGAIECAAPDIHGKRGYPIHYPTLAIRLEYVVILGDVVSGRTRSCYQ